MQIRRATRADLVQLCVTAVKAFASDPVMRWIFPDDDEYLQHGGEVLRGAMSGWVEHNEVWCTDDVAALAVWVQPGRPETPESSDPSLAPPSPELLDRLAIIGPLLAQHAPTQDHWYLQLLATHPDWQRQGLGAALMASMFERADAEGLPCHLETETFVNVGYYRRHGFEVHSEFDIPTGPHEHRFSSFDDDPATEAGPHMWGMLRLSR
ncbi:MAG: GNAT family N-acetyltransferase [Ilumatobacter sp.]|nr:GNAT family N-acetyltransferase [Ilumatobacter sp.]NKB42120.1 GNAT family N-acetyltransferase [Ilumatobacter sp.]